MGWADNIQSKAELICGHWLHNKCWVAERCSAESCCCGAICWVAVPCLL